MSPTRTQPIDHLVAAEMETGSIPAVSVAVVQAGCLVAAKSYGLASLERRIPATNETLFRIASITKTFTATAVMMLVEQGQVDLDDKIRRYLAYLPGSWDAIRLRHLLTHTSGIESYGAVFPANWPMDDFYDELIRRVTKRPCVFRPGQKWGYCNTNYIILGRIIEQVSGRPYRAFVQERIFAPLGMTETCFNEPRAFVPNRAQGYAWEAETLNSPGHPPLSPTEAEPPGMWDYADGGVLSTALDLAKWDAALYTEQLLRQDTLERMWTPARLDDGREAEYGLGWIINLVDGRRKIGHWGRVPGFTAELARFVDEGLTVIVLCNRWKAEVQRLAWEIAGLPRCETGSDEGSRPAKR